MPSSGRPRYPPGRPPHDPINGLRIGGLTGGILGVIVTALADPGHPWLVAIGAVGGGAAGYFTEKRKQQVPPADSATDADE